MNTTTDTITIPLSLNSYYAERYFSKLERIDKSKPFCVAYEKAYQIDDEINISTIKLHAMAPHISCLALLKPYTSVIIPPKQ